MRNRTERCTALPSLPLDLALVFLALLDELLVGGLQLGDVLLQLLVHLHAAVVDLAESQVLLAQVLQRK